MNVTTQQTLRLSVTVDHNGERVRLVFRSNHCFYDPRTGGVRVKTDDDGRAQLVNNWSSGTPNHALPEWNNRLCQLCQTLFDGQSTPNGRRIHYVNETSIIANGNELTVFAYPIDINVILDFVRPIIVKWLDPNDAYPPSRRNIDDVTIVPDSKPCRCQTCQLPCLLQQSYSH